MPWERAPGSGQAARKARPGLDGAHGRRAARHQSPRWTKALHGGLAGKPALGRREDKQDAVETGACEAMLAGQALADTGSRCGKQVREAAWAPEACTFAIAAAAPASGGPA